MPLGGTPSLPRNSPLGGLPISFLLQNCPELLAQGQYLVQFWHLHVCEEHVLYVQTPPHGFFLHCLPQSEGLRCAPAVMEFPGHLFDASTVFLHLRDLASHYSLLICPWTGRVFLEPLNAPPPICGWHCGTSKMPGKGIFLRVC